MAASLFDLLRDMFDGKDLTTKYSDQELKNCGFSVQRIMSIRFPIQAQSQNVRGVNMINVVKYWAVNMKGKFTQMPPWTRIATSKLRKEYQAKKGEIELPEKEICEAFQEFHAMDKHEFAFLVKSKPKELLVMMKEFGQNYRI